MAKICACNASVGMYAFKIEKEKKMDASGFVEPPYSAIEHLGVVYWGDLTPFAQGYIEAMVEAGMWGESCKSCAGNGEIVTDWDRYLGAPEPGDQGDEGTAPCTTCEGRGSRSIAFRDLAPETLALIIADCETWRSERPDMGREFWRIRQEGKRSTFPALTVTLGEDGKVRFA